MGCSNHNEMLYVPTMNIRKGDIIELKIDKMAFGGQGIARVDGLVVFIKKGAVAGDRIIARIFKKKKDYAEANMLELLTPSLDTCVKAKPKCIKTQSEETGNGKEQKPSRRF